jgi:hypothetical protein
VFKKNKALDSLLLAGNKISSESMEKISAVSKGHLSNNLEFID